MTTKYRRKEGVDWVWPKIVEIGVLNNNTFDEWVWVRDAHSTTKSFIANLPIIIFDRIYEEDKPVCGHQQHISIASINCCECGADVLLKDIIEAEKKRAIEKPHELLREVLINKDKLLCNRLLIKEELEGLNHIFWPIEEYLNKYDKESQ